METKTLHQALQEVVGVPMTSVLFVEDYVQFGWKDAGLSAYSALTLLERDQEIGPEDSEYRGAIESLRGLTVQSASFVSGEHIELKFAPSIILRLSLKDEDYVCPEAVNYWDASGQLWVV